MKAYLTAKSALQFPMEKPIPVRLVKKLVRDGLRRHAVGDDDSHAGKKARKAHR